MVCELDARALARIDLAKQHIPTAFHERAETLYRLAAGSDHEEYIEVEDLKRFLSASVGIERMDVEIKEVSADPFVSRLEWYEFLEGRYAVREDKGLEEFFECLEHGIELAGKLLDENKEGGDSTSEDMKSDPTLPAAERSEETPTAVRFYPSCVWFTPPHGGWLPPRR